jgi:hypothetical protein
MELGEHFFRRESGRLDCDAPDITMAGIDG